jgi:hypothetical protein
VNVGDQKKKSWHRSRPGTFMTMLDDRPASVTEPPIARLDGHRGKIEEQVEHAACRATQA